ncbi:MAG: DUF937 domain-containing protein [Acidobacteriota bacterium]|nr:DUF937 domain-containing protein [Acidobacteriota bacterium]MDH3524921.1 DUF937 domain-containing protein [Acidobacteriota bacterium]
MSLVNVLMEQLGGGTARQIGQQLGLDESTASKAIAGALPMVVGGLARNAQQQGGADALLGALDRDHDGSVLDDLSGFLGSGAGSQGESILGHVFGQRKPAVESALGQVSGLDSAKAGQLMAMLAPIVMGALGKQRRQQGLDAGGLAAMLGQERERAGGSASEAMGMVGKLLDRDGDGDFKDDVAKLGASLLGGLFGGKR